jgi:hypothetical protein
MQSVQIKDKANQAGSWLAGKLEEEGSLNTPIFYFLVSPLIAVFLSYILSVYTYNAVIESVGGAFNSISEFEKAMDDISNEYPLQGLGRDDPNKEKRYNAYFWLSLRVAWNKAGNIFLRTYPLIAYGIVAGAILLIPTKRRKALSGFDKISCGVRAICISQVTLLVVNILFFANPFGEKLSDESFEKGVALYWTQIFAGLGAFLLCQQLFLKTKHSEAKPVEAVQRGIEKTASEEDIFIHKPGYSEEVTETTIDSIRDEVATDLLTQSAREEEEIYIPKIKRTQDATQIQMTSEEDLFIPKPKSSQSTE